MEIKVVPFNAQIGQSGSTADIANQLQSLIESNTPEGWEYMRLESVETFVAPDSGCFGLGAKPGYNKVFNMVIFKK
jgi:hypothetical protein